MKWPPDVRLLGIYRHFALNPFQITYAITVFIFHGFAGSRCRYTETDAAQDKIIIPSLAMSSLDFGLTWLGLT